MSWYTVVWIVWILSEIVLNRFMRAKTARKGRDKQSLVIIWITIIVAISLSIITHDKYSLKIFPRPVLREIGLYIIIIGIVIRFWAILTLGRFFTVNLNIKNDHQLVEKGPYKYIRHPSYTGSLLSFFGLGISLNNWFSVIIIFVPVFASFMYRIKIEEQMLLDELGVVYKQYRKRTKRLIPFIY